ncbi:hypothetical protein DJ568_00620 [Mucilaginibacter hurinus]|uniref:Uncharacterized protein n=1 Tax=Mucilaginibacter hurinus TaxID=2201324 RepID=A0A367GU88_9SPHI|nr:hypothetical protein [Mucilaginibacter hurinus]RCH56396.1 hypothetical protein DJ568_00620 [Mucilaginibacter hurinus]
MKKKHLILGLSFAALGFSSCQKSEQLSKNPASTDRAKVANGTIVDAAFTGYFRRTSGWTAGDATLSIPVTQIVPLISPTTFGCSAIVI